MMENLAQRVRESVRLADVLALYHLQPNRAGFLHCPFHSGDRSPSLKVYPEQNTWHCFGCGKSGTVIDFVMEMERCSFVDALKSWMQIFIWDFPTAKNHTETIVSGCQSREKKQKNNQHSS